MDDRSEAWPAVPVPDPAGLLGGDRLLGELERWAADARVTEAAERRNRERWLRQAAEEDATLAGVLADLGERRVGVSVATSAGRRHAGSVAALGQDFVALRLATGAHVLVATTAVAVVRTAAPGPAPLGDRPVRAAIDLAGVLAGLAVERERVLLVARGGDAVSGELRSVGADVVAVRTDGPHRAAAYLPTASITEVSTGGR